MTEGPIEDYDQMERMGEFHSLAGNLLIAGPVLRDPNFARSVVLITEHTRESAIGIVLNRPLELFAADILTPLAEILGRDEPIFQGGPVEPSSVLALGEFRDARASAGLVLGAIGFVRGDVEPSETAAATLRVRAYAGYSGWGAGQLDRELAEDAWVVDPARPEDVFDPEPTGLWRRVLNRKGGKYRIIAMAPLDPTLN